MAVEQGSSPIPAPSSKHNLPKPSCKKKEYMWQCLVSLFEGGGSLVHWGFATLGQISVVTTVEGSKGYHLLLTKHSLVKDNIDDVQGCSQAGLVENTTGSQSLEHIDKGWTCCQPSTILIAVKLIHFGHAQLASTIYSIFKQAYSPQQSSYKYDLPGSLPTIPPTSTTRTKHTHHPPTSTTRFHAL